MDGLSKTVNTFTDYGQQAKDIERRRRMAEMMQQQSMQPIEAAQGAPISWTQGLAKMLQAYSGRRGEDLATEESKALSQRARSEFGDWIGKMPQSQTRDLNLVSNDDEGNVMPAALQTTQPTKQQMMAWAINGTSNPYGAAVAGPMLTEAMKYREPLKLDAGDRWELRDPSTMQLMGVVPKSASPDAILRSGTTLQTHATPSGSAILQNQGATERHLSPSGSAVLQNQGAMQRHATPSGSARLSAQTTMRGQDLGVNPDIQGPLARARAYNTEIGQFQAGQQTNPIAAASDARKILAAVNFAPGKVDEAGNVTRASDDVSKLISKSTSGLLQNWLARGYDAVTGDSTTGRQAIGELTTLANRLTMDLMGGKLGAGVSNTDREFVLGQLGDVSNANIGAPERLAAWKRAIGRIETIAKGAPAQGGAQQPIVVDW